MIRIKQEVLIDRPINQVFAFVSDLKNELQWRTTVQELKAITPGPTGRNTEFRQLGKFLGLRIESSFVIDEFEENRKLGFKTTDGTVESTGGYLFEPVAGATFLTYFCDINFSRLFKIAEPLIGRLYKKRVSSDLEGLKELLQTTTPRVGFTRSRMTTFDLSSVRLTLKPSGWLLSQLETPVPVEIGAVKGLMYELQGAFAKDYALPWDELENHVLGALDLRCGRCGQPVDSRTRVAIYYSKGKGYSDTGECSRCRCTHEVLITSFDTRRIKARHLDLTQGAYGPAKGAELVAVRKFPYTRSLVASPGGACVAWLVTIERAGRGKDGESEVVTAVTHDWSTRPILRCPSDGAVFCAFVGPDRLVTWCQGLATLVEMPSGRHLDQVRGGAFLYYSIDHSTRRLAIVGPVEIRITGPGLGSLEARRWRPYLYEQQTPYYGPAGHLYLHDYRTGTVGRMDGEELVDLMPGVDCASLCFDSAGRLIGGERPSRRFTLTDEADVNSALHILDLQTGQRTRVPWGEAVDDLIPAGRHGVLVVKRVHKTTAWRDPVATVTLFEPNERVVRWSLQLRGLLPLIPPVLACAEHQGWVLLDAGGVFQRYSLLDGQPIDWMAKKIEDESLAEPRAAAAWIEARRELCVGYGGRLVCYSVPEA